MKRFIFLVISLVAFSMSAQEGGFNYKALITDDNDNPVSNHNVGLRFSLINDGTVIYRELNAATTDWNGILSVEIGDGTPEVGDFESIDWNNDIDLKVEINLLDGSGWVDFGTENLNFVPYAKYAKHAEFAEQAANAFSGDYNDLSNIPVYFYTMTNDDLPTSIDDPVYHTGPIYLGFTYMAPRDGGININSNLNVYLNYTGNDDSYGIFNTVFSNATGGSGYGLYNNLNFSGTAYKYGIFNDMSYNSNGYGYAIGLKNAISSTGQTSETIGVVNNLDANEGEIRGVDTSIHNYSNNGDSYGIDNTIYSSQNGDAIGVHNYLSGNELKGMYNDFEGSGSGSHTGIKNDFSGTGNGDAIGMKNNFLDGTGNQVGIINMLNNENASVQAGVVTFFENNSNGIFSGNHVKAAGSGDAQIYVVSDTISNSGNGNHYGFYNYMNGTGNGMKIGVYSEIDPSAGGLQYAIYGSATKPGSFAGYFNGDVRVSQKLLSNDSGSADTKAYVYGSLDSTGQIINDASSSGFTAQKLNDYYLISFTDPTINADNYIVVVTPDFDGAAVIANVRRQSGSFKVYINDTSGNPVNSRFDFVVYKK